MKQFICQTGNSHKFNGTAGRVPHGWGKQKRHAAALLLRRMRAPAANAMLLPPQNRRTVRPGRCPSAVCCLNCAYFTTPPGTCQPPAQNRCCLPAHRNAERAQKTPRRAGMERLPVRKTPNFRWNRRDLCCNVPGLITVQ